MNQTEFLARVLGDGTGYLEVTHASDAFGPNSAHTPQYLAYPLTAPITDDDIVFRPVLLPGPEPGGGMAHVVASQGTLGLPPALPPSMETNTLDGYWQLGEPIPYAEVEELRRRLDPFGKPSPYLWLPGVESSDEDPPKLVEVEQHPSLRTWRVGEIRPLDPPVIPDPVSPEDMFWEPEGDWTVQTYVFSRLGDGGRALGRAVGNEKTPFLKLAAALFDSELTFAEMAWVARQVRSNPYLGRKYTCHHETAHFLSRIRATKHAPGSTIITQIRSIRGKTGKAFDRIEDIAAVVHRDMSSRGRFVHAVDNTYWYVDRFTGEATEISERSERLRIFIHHTYGLNPVDKEHRAVLLHLLSTTGMQPAQGEVVRLSHYRDDPLPSRRQLFIHFGGREVGLLTADGLSADPNGNSGLVFRLPSQADPIVTTSLRTDVPLSWWDEFMPLSFFLSLDGIDPVQASVLMRVWIQFVLFREAARTRPLLAFLGPIGSGKSTMARRFYGLLYGGRKELTSIEGSRDYDVGTSNNPFVVFDNMDQCPGWLPTKMEMSISPRDQERRKLFSDNTVFHLKCDAIVGFTAHDPSIFREGIIDRMLVLTFRRLTDAEKLPDSLLYGAVMNRREEFLSGLLSDALRILRTPRVPFAQQEWDQTIRVVDFVDTGYWLADALGVLPVFREAVRSLKKRQTGLIVEGEGSLVDALLAYKESSNHASEWVPSSVLWNYLCSFAPDMDIFQNQYKTPAVLGAKMASVYAQIKDLLGLEYREDDKTGRKLWRIRPETEIPEVFTK